MEYIETWQKASTESSLTSLCLLGQSVNKDGHPVLWFAETSAHSPLKPLNEIWRKWTEASTQWYYALYQVYVFLIICQQRWPHWPWIDWYIFVFLSATAQWNFTKLNMKQILKILYHVTYVFGVDLSTKMTACAFDWIRHICLLLCNSWAELVKT